MTYSSLYPELVSLFNPALSEISIPGSGIRINNQDFISDKFPGSFFSGEDRSISENIRFSYPVFIPADSSSSKVILLLHGLNERSWNKYLTWAYCLARETGSYVILFPISFHINRSPLSWKDPRLMLSFLRENAASGRKIRNSTVVNIALSSRLSEDPRRFLKSGYQTVNDILKLMRQIRKGEHQLIPQGSRVNIFAYSIGAFLAEILLMSDPDDLFSGSRLFMFCGGSVLINMNGESRFIMDNLASERLTGYYKDHFENEIEGRVPDIRHLVSNKIGMMFRSMIDPARFRKIREKALHMIRDRIYPLGLQNDTIIPPSGIINTLGRSCRVEIIDFKHTYTHENPFPVLNKNSSSDIDRSFEMVFTSASRFLEG